MQQKNDNESLLDGTFAPIDEVMHLIVEYQNFINNEFYPKTWEEFFERYMEKMKEKIPYDPNDADTEEDN